MSKVDAMQAMREARYAAAAANKTATVPKTAAASPRRRSGDTTAVAASNALSRSADPASATVDVLPVTVEVEAEAEEALCGHRSMNNRLCKRPAGHSEKNHRYN